MQCFTFFCKIHSILLPLNDTSFKELNKLQISILKLIMDNPRITQDELARILDVNRRTIIRNFKDLFDKEYIQRVGANKNGYWKINKI